MLVNFTICRTQLIFKPVTSRGIEQEQVDQKVPHRIVKPEAVIPPELVIKTTGAEIVTGERNTSLSRITVCSVASVPGLMQH